MHELRTRPTFMWEQQVSAPILSRAAAPCRGGQTVNNKALIRRPGVVYLVNSEKITAIGPSRRN